MSLIWNESARVNPFVAGEGEATECRFHCAESGATDDVALKHDLEACLAVAITHLNANVKNESLYFMVEWNPSAAVITLTVTDGDKGNDAHDVVTCRFAALAGATGQDAERLSDQVKFLVKDYLSTNGPFMNYSLVALFTDSTRANTQLI